MLWHTQYWPQGNNTLEESGTGYYCAHCCCDTRKLTIHVFISPVKLRVCTILSKFHDSVLLLFKPFVSVCLKWKEPIWNENECTCYFILIRWQPYTVVPGLLCWNSQEHCQRFAGTFLCPMPCTHKEMCLTDCVPSCATTVGKVTNDTAVNGQHSGRRNNRL